MFLSIAILEARRRVDHDAERGAAVVEWLGISALSVGLLVVLFAGMEQIAEAVIQSIRGSLGV